jgi:hypothetical protein
MTDGFSYWQSLKSTADDWNSERMCVLIEEYVVTDDVPGWMIGFMDNDFH